VKLSEVATPFVFLSGLCQSADPITI
jgi:hypothetical protein